MPEGISAATSEQECGTFSFVPAVNKDCISIYEHVLHKMQVVESCDLMAGVKDRVLVASDP